MFTEIGPGKFISWEHVVCVQFIREQAAELEWAGGRETVREGFVDAVWNWMFRNEHNNPYCEHL